MSLSVHEKCDVKGYNNIDWVINQIELSLSNQFPIGLSIIQHKNHEYQLHIAFYYFTNNLKNTWKICTFEECLEKILKENDTQVLVKLKSKANKW